MTFATRLLQVRILLFLSRLHTGGALIEADDQRFGPGSLTIDTATGLGWLDLPLTVGLSYNQILAESGPDGRFAGFRHAGVDEIAGLFVSAGIPDIGEVSEANAVPAMNLIALIGATRYRGIYPETYGAS